MKNTLIGLATFTLVFSQTSFAKPFKCTAAFDAGGIGLSMDMDGELEMGQKITLTMQGYNFAMERFDDEKGVKFINATVENPKGDETTALYALETPVVQMQVKEGPSTTYKFSCLAK